jgi:hypothetical protein
MKPNTKDSNMPTTRSASTAELLIQADGKILAHNLTPAVAELLSAINPLDELMKKRSQAIQSRSRDELPART